MRSSCVRFCASLAVWMGLAVVACGGPDSDREPALLEAAAGAQREQRAEEVSAREALAELIVRHSLTLSAAAGSSLSFDPELARWATPRRRGARAWSASFPELSDEAFEIADEASGLGARVRARGAASVMGGQAGEFLVYPNGYGPGTTLLYRVGDDGFEDYVALDERPREPRLTYELILSKEVAGLRLVERILELIDERGAPRLRVSPPFVVDAAGRRTRAELEVKGCELDQDPSAPWDRSPVPPGAAQCVIEISWEDAALEYPALIDPAWGPAGNMAVARQRFGAALLPNGRVLVAGGLSGSPPVAVASAELYDPGTSTWSTTGAMTLSRSEHALTLREGGAVLVSGGRDEGGELSAGVEQYDASLGMFTQAAPLPEPRAGHRAVVLSNGDVLVAGGAGSSNAARLLRTAMRWQDAGSLGAEQPGSSLTALAGGRALLVGPNPPHAQLFDPDTGTWRATRAPASSRSEHTATRLSNGQVLIAGGTGGHSVEVYDPRSDAFRSAGALDHRRVGHSATLLPDGHVVVVGGAGSGAAETEIFNPTWGTWAPGPSPIEPRASHEAVLLADGRLLIAGGLPAGSSPVETELDEPPALASSEELDARLPSIKLSEYRFQATFDQDVASVVTELWAAVARPSVLEPGRRYPLLLFLHGNHATCGTGANPRQDIDCTYTEDGVCPSGFVVVPSHRGYDYVISELAARGYVVVSVNANRGINCGGGDAEDVSMNLARGRLLLRHLQRLSEWHRGVAPTPPSIGVSLAGKLDFSQVGIMGHSRGGEGARAAYQQFRDPGSPWPARIVEPLSIRGIFEIGPVDGQTPRTFDADGTSWSVLLPMCDGDVSDLQGVKPFDRMLALTHESLDTFKSTLTAWGTNHNFFNTEWQESDSPGCTHHQPLFASGPGITGSSEQRQIGSRSVLEFFLGAVGREAQPERALLFDPLTRADFHTRIDRGYTPGLGPSVARTLEDFSARTGLGMGLVPTVSRNVRVTHGSLPEHDGALRGAAIQWSSASSERFFEVRFTSDGASLDLSAHELLEFRIDRAPEASNLEDSTEVAVQIVNPDGTLSGAIHLSERGIVLDGPVGGPFDLHSMLQTVRLPFADFPGARSEAVSGVRFSFSDPRGSLFLASIRASAGSTHAASAPLAADGARPAPTLSGVLTGSGASVVPSVDVRGNRIVALRLASDQAALDQPDADRDVEIELRVSRAFQARDELLVLDLGGKAQTRRSYHPGGDLRRAVFSLDPMTYAAVADGDVLSVQYGSSSSRKSAADKWDFGPLDKSMLIAPRPASP